MASLAGDSDVDSPVFGAAFCGAVVGDGMLVAGVRAFLGHFLGAAVAPQKEDRRQRSDDDDPWPSIAPWNTFLGLI
jgi:hypothetical protein